MKKKEEQPPDIQLFIKLLYARIAEINLCIKQTSDIKTQRYLQELKDIYKLDIDNLTHFLTQYIIIKHKKKE